MRLYRNRWLHRARPVYVYNVFIVFVQKNGPLDIVHRNRLYFSIFLIQLVVANDGR